MLLLTICLSISTPGQLADNHKAPQALMTCIKLPSGQLIERWLHFLSALPCGIPYGMFLWNAGPINNKQGWVFPAGRVNICVYTLAALAGGVQYSGVLNDLFLQISVLMPDAPS